MSRIEDADKQRRAEERGAPPNTFFGVARGIVSHQTAEVSPPNSSDLLNCIRLLKGELEDLAKGESCDHEVGICWCGVFSALNEADRLLKQDAV